MANLSQTYEPTSQAVGTFTVAVGGNPNCGKTTLFNALTGSHYRVGNYAGVTVEHKEGYLLGQRDVRLLDLPGTYSLSARSPDERIARDVVLGHLEDVHRPNAVLVVVDASNLERNLFLASQVIELGLPTVVVCNMMDCVKAAGCELDLDALSRLLGVPVVGTVGHRKTGIDEVRSVVTAMRTIPAVVHRRAWSLPTLLEQAVSVVASSVIACGHCDEASADGAALILLSETHPPGESVPVIVRSAVAEALDRLGQEPALDASLEITSARYGWLAGIVDECLKRPAGAARRCHSDRLDSIFLHRIWGTVSFGLLMAFLFFSIFSLASPLMSVIEVGVGWTQDWVNRAMPPGVLRALLTEGVIAGVGNVVIFFPQICILFLCLSLLEDTGYMARAAFLMDRLMRKVGLHGKSFIPLLSSHACAIPGIMATRTIEDSRDRLVTILVAPLMSCSARLPVYTIMIAACLPGGAWIKAMTMLSMYLLGIIAAFAMATILKRFLLKGEKPAFIMELPPYRMPRLGAVIREMWDRSKLFLVRAGTVILAVTVVLWSLMQYPTSTERDARFEAERVALIEQASPDLDEQLAVLQQSEAAENLENSFAGMLGRLIEPAIRPLGFDWHIGVGVIASFAAREVFVGTLGIIYSVGESDESSPVLRDQIRAARWPDGSPVFTPLVAVSVMVFFVLACQCVSTIAVVRRETNSWRWPVFMFAYMTVLAYVGSLVVYQVGSLLGIGVA